MSLALWAMGLRSLETSSRIKPSIEEAAHPCNIEDDPKTLDLFVLTGPLLELWNRLAELQEIDVVHVWTWKGEK